MTNPAEEAATAQPAVAAWFGPCPMLWGAPDAFYFAAIALAVRESPPPAAATAAGADRTPTRRSRLLAWVRRRAPR